LKVFNNLTDFFFFGGVESAVSFPRVSSPLFEGTVVPTGHLAPDGHGGHSDDQRRMRTAFPPRVGAGSCSTLTGGATLRPALASVAPSVQWGDASHHGPEPCHAQALSLQALATLLDSARTLPRRPRRRPAPQPPRRIPRAGTGLLASGRTRTKRPTHRRRL
jgi:hypothetical protein